MFGIAKQTKSLEEIVKQNEHRGFTKLFVSENKVFYKDEYSPIIMLPNGILSAVYYNSKKMVAVGEEYRKHECLHISDIDGNLIYEYDECLVDSTKNNSPIGVIRKYRQYEGFYIFYTKDGSGFTNSPVEYMKNIKIIGNRFNAVER